MSLTRGHLFMTNTQACPFCALPQERILIENEHGAAIRDGFPVSPGHTLIIPKYHVASFFEIGTSVRAGLFVLLDQAKEILDQEYRPTSYNIGINDGAAAGQTIPHMHIHLIPRFQGDQLDPRGGIRWVIPEKADYWTKRP
jgi:diadenosine tetraphosphate (Ap4A) HIT family hydrolase